MWSIFEGFRIVFCEWILLKSYWIFGGDDVFMLIFKEYRCVGMVYYWFFVMVSGVGLLWFGFYLLFMVGGELYGVV